MKGAEVTPWVKRIVGNPIIRPNMDSRMGSNINGPSLIRVPDWVPGPLGRYYLYFADHRDSYIRLAYADFPEGPYRTYEPGTLRLEQTGFIDHIASPDVHVVDDTHEIRMYFHGLVDMETYKQRTRVAVSSNGIDFTVHDEILGPAYFRVFRWDGWWYALAMPGYMARSRDGITGWEHGPRLFDDNMRHSAVLVEGGTLRVFYSIVGDRPEHIVQSTIDLGDDWMAWKETPPATVVLPETDYEGIDLPIEPSKRGEIRERVRQLRDPAVYQEDEQRWLLYSVAGENGIAMARFVP